MKTPLKNIKFLFFVICFISIFIDSKASWAAGMDRDDQPGNVGRPRARELGENSPLIGHSPASTPTSSSPSLATLREASRALSTTGSQTPPTVSRFNLREGEAQTDDPEDTIERINPERKDKGPLRLRRDSSAHSSFSSQSGQRLHAYQGPQLQSSLGQIYFQGGNAMDTSALLIYTLTDRRAGRSWDNNSQFMRSFDKEFFKEDRSWTVLGTGIFGALVGISMPATPVTGSIMWGIGNALKIPISGGVSDAIVSEIMITMSPIFARQFFTRAQIMARSLTCEQDYPAGHEDNRPHVIDPIFAHSALKFVVGGAAMIEGTFYFGLAYVAEGSEFRPIALAMGPVLALALAERYYTIGRASLDRFFVRYWYDTAVVYQQRMALIEQAKRTLREVEHNDRFVKEIYRIVQREMKVDYDAELGEVGSQHYFAVSALFLRHMVSASGGDVVEEAPPQDGEDTSPASAAAAPQEDREDTSPALAAAAPHEDREDSPHAERIAEQAERIAELERVCEKSESDNKKLQTFKALVDRMTPSAKEAFMDYLSIFLSGAGDFSRLLAREYILELVLEQIMSVDPVVSTNTAWCLAGTDILIRNILEFGIQKDSMRGWLDTFSLRHLVDFQYLRKGLGCFSVLNGGWFALANTVASILNFQSMNVPLSLQIVCVIPAFIQDQGYIMNYHRVHTNELITDMATLKLGGEPGIIRQRAWCNYWLQKLERFLEIADTETIMVLFNKTQRAL